MLVAGFAVILPHQNKTLVGCGWWWVTTTTVQSIYKRRLYFTNILSSQRSLVDSLSDALTTFYENKQECLHMIGSNVALKVNEQALQKVRNKLGAKAFDVRRITCGFD